MTAVKKPPGHVLRAQIEASDPDRSVFVSANAGSGKTHVLVQRVINLLLRGCDPSKILCITFTKAAAANMSNRVFDTLAEWATLDDDMLGRVISESTGRTADADERRRARRLFACALETPGGLKVQTIHAFCTRLLHQFPFEADVAARFTVLDEATTTQLLEKITLDVLLEASNKPDSALGRALAHAIIAAADSTLKDVIGEAIRKRDALTAWIERAGGLDQALAELASALDIAPGDSQQAIDNEYFSNSLIPHADWAALMQMLSNGTKSDQKHVAALEAARAATDRPRIDAYLQVFCTTELKRRERVLTKALGEEHPEWLERLLAEQDRVCALVARERAVACRDRTAALLTIAAEVIVRYRTEKDRRGLLDYEDQIDKTLALFTKVSAAWVLYKLDLGIDHVLVDEAQDTSPKQWEIIKTIVSEFVPGGSRQNTRRTVFAVGDQKQSIFSFQGAAPDAFDAARRHFKRVFRNAELEFIERDFPFSFRSGPDLLEAVDAVFKRPEAHGGLAHDPVPTAHQALPGAAPGEVEIWELAEPSEKREIEGWDAPFDTVSEKSPPVMLARRIARKIKNWIESGTQPGEVLVLVRQRKSQFEAIIRALKDAQIPVAGADRLKLVEHIAVMDLLVLADALLLPDDDLALATVLKSPLFALSEDDLFTLAWRREGTLRASLRGKAGENPAFAMADAALDQLSAAARAMPPFAFYAHVLGAGKGRTRFLSRLGHEATDALDEFLDLALDYERRETPSLQGFLAWIRTANAEVKRDMELARNEVRVMTVHGAKGLEAKNVILADTATKPAGPHDPRLLPLDSGGAVVWANAKANDVGVMGEARERARRAAEDEYRRLLYVAMTRAADRLVICGAKGRNEIPDGCWYRLVRDALEPLSERVATEDGEILRFCKTKSKSRPKKPPIKASQTSHPLPDWLKPVVAAEAPVERIVTASRDEGDEQPRPAASDNRRAALSRGRLAHRLLQSLPDIPPEHRAAAAKDFLAMAGKDVGAAAHNSIIAKVFGVLDDTRFAPLFVPTSRAEVSIVGRVTLGGETVLVAGQVDRMAVTAEEILIADYKTHRPAPSRIEDVPFSHKRQLALYRAVLALLYPGKRIRAALIWTETADLMELSPEVLDAAFQITSPRARLDGRKSHS